MASKHPSQQFLVQLNHYLYSDKYNPTNMFQVNIRLLELYNNLVGYADLYELED